jgi:hypothetical protein
MLLTREVVKIAAKLMMSNRRAKPSTDLSTPLDSFMSHMSMSFCFSALVIRRVSSDVDRRTGLSSQLSPNSSIFAKRSSTIGLMNSSCCRICDGRLDIIRATTLTSIKQHAFIRREGHVRPEKAREQIEECRFFHNIDREVQIQLQIVSISAYGTLVKRRY